MRGARIEPAIGTPCQPRDFPKSLLGDRVVALLKHESRNAEQPKLPRRVAEIIELLLHGIAAENQGLYLTCLGFTLAVAKNFADLGMAAPPSDSFHHATKPVRCRSPMQNLPFPHPPPIAQRH